MDSREMYQPWCKISLSENNYLKFYGRFCRGGPTDPPPVLVKLKKPSTGRVKVADPQKFLCLTYTSMGVIITMTKNSTGKMCQNAPMWIK